MDKAHIVQREQLSSGTTASFDTAAPPSPPIIKELETPTPAMKGLWWPRFRAKYQNFFSEFMGVFIMILFGNGSVAQSVLSNNKNGNFLTIFMGWG